MRERHIHAGREPIPDAVTGKLKWWGSLCGYAMTRREYGASKGTEGPLCWVCMEEAKRLRKEGHTVKCFTDGKQLVSRGGIGSGNPHIEQWVSVYGLLVLG